MFGEVEGSLSAGSPLRYSTDLPSRISSNSLKTNDGCHGYPSRNREDNSPGFRSPSGEKIHSSSSFTEPIRSKLAQGSSQESRSRWPTHYSR